VRRTLLKGLLPLLALVGLLFLTCRSGTLAPVRQSDLAQTQIYAYRDWQSTGVRIDAGSRLHVQADGAWSYTPGEFNGPEGHPRYRSPDFYPLRGVPGGILIGRIGDTGHPFVVGKQIVHAGGREHGLLFLRINDDILSDNDGAVTVHITVEAAPAE